METEKIVLDEIKEPEKELETQLTEAQVKQFQLELKKLRIKQAGDMFKNIKPGINKVGVTRKVKAKSPNKNIVIKKRHHKTTKEKKATRSK